MTNSTYVRVRTAEDIGKIALAAREQQNLRQMDMADIIGKSHVLLRSIEKGNPSVSLGTVLHLLDELGIHVYLDVPK
ncbi:Helix-turn-helix protein [Pseudomonas luteola]|uniref:Helix-turn-helix domain-containing protein n=2 Tax=Pseudomonas TaxID=286 RepID=A0A2X2CIJ5_PSELU|nr:MULTISPECIES: helix-turn-helix domain-containing protein [Pseudomonas]MBA1250163.1 helix-turn-helix domain-containing protein [Pseudomonas zeshuii]MBH3440914.1 helix-turn-helix domain-containing protein [Pseudomonas luteola]SPY99985.1 Helix-turn-helix protein [Pseudomonas luteola]